MNNSKIQSSLRYLNAIVIGFICMILSACSSDDECMRCSCGRDYDNCNSNCGWKGSSGTSNTAISKPVVKVTSRKADVNYDGWWVIGTVTTGGDNPSNVTCYLEWSAFTTKQTGNVTLTNRDLMNVTNSSKTSVQFKKEHAGIRGKYIYFRLVGSNSKYTETTPTDYMVATTR